MNRNRFNHRRYGIALVAATWLLTAPAVWAVDEHHPEQNAGPAAAAPPASAKDSARALQQMKQNADKFPAQMDAILKTKDPAERQKLMQEHMQTLRASLTMAAGAMGGMPGSGGMMMDCPMMGQMMGGGMMGEQMMQRMHEIEKRMDMMQMMFEDIRKK